MRRTFLTLVAMLSLLVSSPALAVRIGVAPLAGSGLTMDEARVARSLFIHDLQRELPQDLVVELRQDSWMSLAPVLELLAEAREQQLDRMVVVSADRLGEKLILQLRVLDVKDESSLFTDNLPVSDVEDVDTAMLRAARAVAKGKSIDEVREVGQVLENEGLRTRRREALKVTHWQAGYIWPQTDHAEVKSQRDYDGHARRFTVSLSNGIEDRNFDAGWTLAWRYGPAIQLYSDYLFRAQDTCPYLGAALGFHWALDKEIDQHGNSDTGLDDGFHLAARTGVILFRTYDFQMTIEGSYLVTWNDDLDRGFQLTLGVRP